MDLEREQALISETVQYIRSFLQFSQMSDEELEDKIQEIVNEKLKNEYCPVDQLVAIVQQVFNSFRGLGLLDTIINDETITE